MVTHFTSTNFKWGERHRGEHKNDAVLKHVDSHFNPLPALLRLTFCLNDYKGPLELSIPTGAPRSDSCHGNPLILEGTELPLGMNSKRRPAPVTQRSPEPQRQPWHSKSGKKSKKKKAPAVDGCLYYAVHERSSQQCRFGLMQMQLSPLHSFVNKCERSPWCFSDSSTRASVAILGQRSLTLQEYF